MNNSSLNHHLKKFSSDLLLKAKAKTNNKKEIMEEIASFNELIGEKKETKDEIKRHSSLLENLRFEHSELIKRQQSIEDNILLIKANDLSTKAKETKAKIKQLFTEMYYNKELVESTQLKLSLQTEEINHYGTLYPQLKPEIEKFNNKRGRPIYNKQLEVDNRLLEERIAHLEKESYQEELKHFDIIKAQEKQIKRLRAEIDEMNKSRISSSIERSVIIDKPLAVLISPTVSSKRIREKPMKKYNLKRHLSIEAKTKRKPFANFVFISTDPFLIGL